MALSQIKPELTQEMLCHQKEGQYLERKGRSTKPAKIASELIGMLNAGGGLLVYGIADDGTIEDLLSTALPLETDPPNLDGYRTLVQDFILPPSNIAIEEVYLKDGELVFLYHVDQDYERLFQRKGTEEVYLRVADSNRKQDREGVRTLEYNKQIRKFEDETRADFDPIDLDSAECGAYLDTLKFQGSFEEAAVNRALAVRDGDRVLYKNCAILLFSKNPDKYIASASVRYVRYRGNEQKSGKDFNVIKDQRFEGAIPGIIDTLANFVEASLRDYYFFDAQGGVFRRIPEIPRDAWFEGIVNALCHRSYNMQGNPIVIKHFDDRLEISNSGPLPPPVTVENIREERFARNPRIARVLYELGHVRELNEGVKRIYGAMEELSLSKPEYTDHANTVTLTLRNKVTAHEETIYAATFKRIQDRWEQLNNTQQDIVLLIIERKQVTIGELMDSIKVSEQAVRKNLNKLIGLQILEKVSEKKRDLNAVYRFMAG